MYRSEAKRFVDVVRFAAVKFLTNLLEGVG